MTDATLKGNDRYQLGPVRRGDLYCSPWCGCGCTFAAFEARTAEAQALAERMGPGWQPRVWENCGWHCTAVKGETRHHAGLFEIHPPSGADGSYSAWINPATEGVSQIIVHDAAGPIEAMGLAMPIRFSPIATKCGGR